MVKIETLRFKEEVENLHKFAKIFYSFKNNPETLLEELKNSKIGLNNQRENFRDYVDKSNYPKVIKFIRFVILDKILENKPLSIDLINQIKENIAKKNEEYFNEYPRFKVALPNREEIQIRKHWNPFSILFQIYFNIHNEEISSSINYIKGELSKFLEKEAPELKGGYAEKIMDFKGARNYGSSSTWIAFYPAENFYDHKFAFQIFFEVYEGGVIYGIGKGSEIEPVLDYNKNIHQKDVKIQNFNLDKMKEDLLKLYGNFVKYNLVIKKKLMQKNYWQLALGKGAAYWDTSIKNNTIGMSFNPIPKDFGEELFKFKDLDEFKKALMDYYLIDNGTNVTKDSERITSEQISRRAPLIWDFINTMQIGDIVVINRGKKEIIGKGRVIQGRKIDLTQDLPIIRNVKWLETNLKIPIPIELKGLFGRQTITKLEKHQYDLIFKKKNDTINKEIMEEIDNILNYKKQIILYGPPGTGKTYIANKFCKNYKCDDSPFFTTFHQSYAYEEFIEGLKPDTSEENELKFIIEEGTFKKACRFAFNALMNYCAIEQQWGLNINVPILDDNNFDKILKTLKSNDFPRVYFIIDEINRADISRIFGELITLIEPNKRLFSKEQISLILPYSKKTFGVPPNLYIIGTMNTADRSIALLDIALRRRFGFKELMPDYEILKKKLLTEKLDNEIRKVRKIAIDALISINKRIDDNYDRDHQIGHSYLLNLEDDKTYDDSIHKLQIIWKSEIIPLLREYFYDNPKKINKILNCKSIEDFEKDIESSLSKVAESDRKGEKE